MIIDIVLVIFIAIIALVAARFIPTDEDIKNNEAGLYKSKIKIIYIAGASSIIVGILLLVFYAIYEDYQLLINLGKVVFLMIIGIALININFKKAKAVAAFEGTAPAASAPIEGTAEAGVVTATNVATAAPTAQPQTVTAQVTTAQVAQAQPVVQAQPQTAIQRQVPARAVKTPVVKTQPKQIQPKIININCPKCKGAMQINTAMLGQKIKCPHCGVEGRIG
ncbi:MAG: hypothetical protein JSW00_12625 [Thermoplasmata archaeon]|nr:MAG: hypothetical protein JSW00_12625 [Thermoplasmata archaeon]